MNHPKSQSLLAAVILALFFSRPLVAAQTASLVSYHLRVRIDPAAGSLAADGIAEVPPQDFSARSLNFYLDETLSISKLLVNGRKANFTYGQPGPLVCALIIWTLLGPILPWRFSHSLGSSSGERRGRTSRNDSLDNGST